MMAMMLYDNYIARFGLLKTDAGVEVGLLFGISDKTIRLWRRDFLSNSGEFSEHRGGSTSDTLLSRMKSIVRGC